MSSDDREDGGKPSRVPRQCPLCYETFITLPRHIRQKHKKTADEASLHVKDTNDKLCYIRPYVTKNDMDDIVKPTNGFYCIAHVVRLLNGLGHTVVGDYANARECVPPLGATMPTITANVGHGRVIDRSHEPATREHQLESIDSDAELTDTDQLADDNVLPNDSEQANDMPNTMTVAVDVHEQINSVPASRRHTRQTEPILTETVGPSIETDAPAANIDDYITEQAHVTGDNSCRGDIYRGRKIVGKIRAMRKTAGLSDGITWSEHNDEGCEHLNQFFTFLMRAKDAFKTACAKNQVNMVSKMLCFVQNSAGLPTQSTDPTAFLKYHKFVEVYHDRLTKDLNGEKKGYGLSPNALKNEFQSVEKYCCYLEENDETLNHDLIKALRKAHNSIRVRLSINITRINKVSTQMNIERNMEGIDNDALQAAGSIEVNERIVERLYNIVALYGKHGTTLSRNDNQSDHVFLTRYLIHELTLRHGQRPGVAMGLTFAEYMLLTKRVMQNKNAKLQLSVADHKTGAQRPAIVGVSAETYELLRIYAKRFRSANAGPHDKFFLRYGTDRPYTNISKEIHDLQKEFNVKLTTATGVRRAVQSQAEDDGLDPLIQNSLNMALGHSAQTAKLHYKQQGAYSRVQQGDDYVNKLIGQKQNLPSMSSNRNMPAQGESVMASREPQTVDKSTQGEPGKNTAPVSPPSSVESAESDCTTDTVRIIEITKAMFAKFPVRIDIDAPSVNQLRKMMKSMSAFEGLSDDISLRSVEKNLTSKWREVRHVARGKHLLEKFPRRKFANIDETTAEISKLFPSWKGIFKVAKYVIASHTSAKPRTKGLPSYLTIDTITKLHTSATLKLWPDFAMTKPHLSQRGMGVFTTKLVSKGQVLFDYSGVYLTGTEGDRKYNETSQDTTEMSYMYRFKLNDKTHYRDCTIDNGTMGRLVNHSRCCSNIRAKPVDIECNGRPHIFFETLHDIETDEELLFDYGDHESTASFFESCPKCDEGNLRGISDALQSHWAPDRSVALERKRKRHARNKQTSHDPTSYNTQGNLSKGEPAPRQTQGPSEEGSPFNPSQPQGGPSIKKRRGLSERESSPGTSQSEARSSPRKHLVGEKVAKSAVVKKQINPPSQKR